MLRSTQYNQKIKTSPVPKMTFRVVFIPVKPISCLPVISRHGHNIYRHNSETTY